MFLHLTPSPVRHCISLATIKFTNLLQVLDAVGQISLFLSKILLMTHLAVVGDDTYLGNLKKTTTKNQANKQTNKQRTKQQLQQNICDKKPTCISQPHL